MMTSLTDPATPTFATNSDYEEEGYLLRDETAERINKLLALCQQGNIAYPPVKVDDVYDTLVANCGIALRHTMTSRLAYGCYLWALSEVLMYGDNFPAHLKRAGIGKSSGYNLITAAQVCSHLVAIVQNSGKLPRSISQCLALDKVGKTEADICDAWETLTSNQEQPTVDTIKTYVAARQQPPARLTVDPPEDTGPEDTGPEGAEPEDSGEPEPRNYSPFGEKRKDTDPKHKPDSEFHTPDWIYQPLHEEFGFSLDPAASDANHKCDRYFTAADDGLKQSWAGDTVWVNPPFQSTLLSLWVAKAYAESCLGAVVVILIPTKYRETKWWAECCVNGQVRFIHPYVRFERSDGRKGTALKDVVVVVFGKEYKPLSSGPAITGRIPEEGYYRT